MVSELSQVREVHAFPPMLTQVKSGLTSLAFLVIPIKYNLSGLPKDFTTKDLCGSKHANYYPTTLIPATVKAMGLACCQGCVLLFDFSCPGTSSSLLGREPISMAATLISASGLWRMGITAFCEDAGVPLNNIFLHAPRFPTFSQESRKQAHPQSL